MDDLVLTFECFEAIDELIGSYHLDRVSGMADDVLSPNVLDVSLRKEKRRP